MQKFIKNSEFFTIYVTILFMNTIKKTKKASPSRGKRSPGKAAAGKNTALAKELSTLIPRLDEEGLRFLIQQAQIHLYNMQVDELNQNMIREQAVTRRTTKPAAKPKQAAQTRSGPARTAGLSLKAGESSASFYLAYNGDWVMFTDTEIIALAKIAAGPDSDRERAERIYRWLERERRDTFAVVPIRDKFSPLLIEMIRILKKNFKIGNR